MNTSVADLTTTTSATTTSATTTDRLTSTLALVYAEVELLLTKFRGGEKDQDGRRWIWASNKQIHQRLMERFPYLKISVSTVQRALRKLIDQGWLLGSQRKRQRCWSIQFYALPEFHPQAEAANELATAREVAAEKQATTGKSQGDSQTLSSYRSTNRRKAPIGFGKSNSRTALTEINASATRPAQKPEKSILINGIWCCDDDLFPSYA